MTESDVIRSKVGDSPWGVILIVRGVFYHVCVLTVVFLLNNIKAADRGVYAAAAAVDLGIYTAAADRGIYSAVAAAAAILTE